MSDEPVSSAWLIPLPGGPALEPLEIKPGPGGAVIGRHEGCAIRLPADADKVSRQHARFSFHDGQWRVTDLGSRWGTFVNGVKIPPQRQIPVDQGDLVRIVPWTFSFSTVGVPRKGLLSEDDTATSANIVRGITVQSASAALEDSMVNLLLEGASSIHAVHNEEELANLLMDIASRGTGLPNVAVLRALDSAGRIEVISSKWGADGGENKSHAFSRSLLATAAGGVVAEMSATTEKGSVQASISQSMVQMNIDAAICAPLMLGTTVAAYLYLDSRGGAGRPRTLRPNAAGFSLALAKMASLAMANLKRLELERRSARFNAEMIAAATAQRSILPSDTVRVEPFACVGISRPGEFLGGDFFDVLALPDGRMAVTLGDVAGHGIAAAVLMTAAHGFLHAALSYHGDLARAVTDLNSFVHARQSGGKFLTLWAGLFDPRDMSVSFVDAGHGYAMLADAQHKFGPLTGDGGLPVGLLPDTTYTVTQSKLSPGGRVLIVSDGLVEQTSFDSLPGTGRKQFELDGVQAALTATGAGQNVVEQIFQAVYKFAGGTTLNDDATAVLVTW